MYEIKKPVEINYSVFNEENWQYNVDKAFFIFMLGMIYTVISLVQKNFEASIIEIFARIITSPFAVLFMIVMIESFVAVIVKIAFEPGIIIESKFKVILNVFWNTLKDSYKQAFTFKQVYFTKTIRVKPLFSFSSSICISRGIGDLRGGIDLPGYMKIPEHFKY